MSTRQQLRDAQKRLREATKKRKEGIGENDPAFTQLGLEQAERFARDEVKGLQEKAAEENRQARDQRRENARAAKTGSRYLLVLAPFIGSRLGVSPQQSLSQTSGMPIDATYLDDGKVDFSGVADNQVLRQRDGTFVKYSQETGQAYPVVFDVDRDTFVSENYKTPEGIGNIKRRLATSMSDIGRFALDTGNFELQTNLQDLQQKVDAVDNDVSLRPKERDQALVDLYNQNRYLV